MKKFWIVYCLKNNASFLHMNTKEEATNEAKRLQAADQNNCYWVLESVAVTVKPVPQIEMQELV